jgi:hypothetical protein
MSFETFGPDLLVGLLTGVVVGAVIIFYERSLAAKREAREAQSQASRLVHPLLLAIQRLEADPDYDKVVPLPRRIDRALKLVEGSDLDRWRELSDSALVTRLYEFRDAGWDLREDAHDLDVAIQRWKRLHQTVDGTVEYGTAEILGAGTQYLVEAFPESEQRQTLAREAENFHAHRLVKKHTRHYRKAMSKTEGELGALHSALTSEIRSIRGVRNSSADA